MLKNMKDNYPQQVCFDCLYEAVSDTLKYDDRKCFLNEYYTSYVVVCDVCGELKECTEPRDAGYPVFKYVLTRIRSKKIKKITNK
jgi:hypothetical protein